MPPVKKPRRPCEVPDCPRVSFYTHTPLCRPHLRRMQRHGDVMAGRPIQSWRGGRKQGQTAGEPVSGAGVGWWCKPCRRTVPDLLHAPAFVVGGEPS